MPRARVTSSDVLPACCDPFTLAPNTMLRLTLGLLVCVLATTAPGADVDVREILPPKDAAANPVARDALARDALPAFMKVGARITYESTAGSTKGSHLVEDPAGNIRGADGRRYSRTETGGGGGHGFTQLDICHASPEAIVADLQFDVFVQPE